MHLPATTGIAVALGLGVVCGVLNAVYAISYASLAFPGPLVGALPAALSLGLLSSAILGIVTTLLLRYPGSSAVISPEATLVLGGVGLQFATDVEPDGLLPTMLATIALVSLATSATLFAVGRARLGYLMHYLPFPVVAGLIGGLGILLVIGGLDLAVPGFASRALISRPEAWLELAATAAFGTILWLWHFCRPSPFNLPFMVLLGTAGLWAVTDLWEVPAAWLLGPFPVSPITLPGATWGLLDQVDWAAIAMATPTLAMLVMFLSVIVLTDVASLEVALNEHIEPDQALQTLGLANAASGAIGGFTGVMSISGTIMAHRGGAPCRLVGVVAALVSFGFYLVGPGLFGWVPGFVVGGLIVFVGLEFVTEWIVQLWRRLSWPDRAILLAVVAGVSLAGFAEGFVIGLLLGFVFFVVGYSRLPAIRHETTGQYRFSHVERSEDDRQWLRAGGQGTMVLELSGFLFFGSAWRIYDRVRRRAMDPTLPPLGAVLLDFRRVAGVDSSGWHNFRRVAELGGQHGFEIVFSHLPQRLEQLLRLETVIGAHRPHVRLVDDLDRGLECIENLTLARRPPGLAEAAATFDGGPFDPAITERLGTYVEPRTFAAGETLIRQGDASDDVYIVRRGSISILVDGPEGGRIRLRTAGPGTVIGEIAFILRQPRTAWAVADTEVRADRISRAAVARMAAEEPQLLLRLQGSMLRILASRVSDSTRLVVQLSR
ncbi:MAG: cyclic nucleotide-binding domain-containing protein [Geminicoccaceae bacterium]